jgi:hypothetical protein
MPFRRRPRKSPINEFVSMIAPDRIGEAYERVEVYFTDHLNLSFDSPEGVAGVLDELIRQNGEPVRRSLYTLFCDPDSSLRKAAEESLLTGGVKSAVEVLEPLLAAQFSLAPAVALLVATLLIKAVAAHGEKAVCEELTQQHRKAARGIRNAVKKKAEVTARAAASRTRANPYRKTVTPRPDLPGGPPESSRRKPAARPKAPSKKPD